MVAYGVLELKHKDQPPVWIGNDLELKVAREDDRQRDELRKLVNDELKRYGLLLQREVVPTAGRYRTRLNTHILYGQAKGPKGFPTREVVMKGSFRECCQVAAEILDGLNRAQIPDTATGID
jgi:hypothetical protein